MMLTKTSASLITPVRDANLLAKQFEAIGYETRLNTNLDEFNFNKLLKSIGTRKLWL